MKQSFKYIFIITVFALLSCETKEDVSNVRKEISLNENWETIHLDSLNQPESDFVKSPTAEIVWKKVSVPHNWDQYYGYRRAKHGNLHGTAWYKKTLTFDKQNQGKQHFLFFEGVGSYATVWVNRKPIGEHKGGRTTFTLNITDAINFDTENTIIVKAEHPTFIADLPWVCGGCSGEWGFSEGSQPMGIFRPVSLIITNDVRIEPFGVHIWNDDQTNKEKATLHIATELKNYSGSEKKIKVENILLNHAGDEVSSVETVIENLSDSKEIKQSLPEIYNPQLWSPEHPYLYQLATKIYENDELVDALTTPYGIRWISWPINREDDDNRFFINGEPFFINGTCEYEHLIGKSHSFSETEIQTRIEQVKAAGYNAFREGHQPHNLRYQEHLDEEGILFWSQFSAHIWYDTPEFKQNFKTLLKEWIKERRNNPSVVMWGLQNESTIPKEFAEECTQIIRELDPTSAKQRIVTTCNGGEGTDWNVIQNWSGTYGGDPYNYGEELTEQLLNGEYGGWRSADLHTEGEFNQKGELSENRFTQLMEIKVREAESVWDKIVGQYHWLLYSHENPGRSQNGEGFRDIDKVGPVNYKGIFTIWGEPLDAFYMYRANYVPKEESPMVYIVSHTWPNRWESPGIKNGIDIYSNCDEVELFNDVENSSLGRLNNPGLGKHFQWNNVNIKYNVLYAVGYVNGKAVAKDYIVLNNLPEAPNFEKLVSESNDILKPDNINYLYRVNCGGSDYTDTFGNTWLADVHKTDENTWGSLSWTDDFENLPAFYASQRHTNDPIANTKDWSLFQSFRYGANKLKYEFPVPDSKYLVELFFNEPWHGTGGGINCQDWRVFDIAINGETVEEDLDIWNEVGHDAALKKSYTAESKNGKMVISFPNVASGQAVISAIAIASKDKNMKPAKPSEKDILNVQSNIDFEIGTWLNLNHKQYLNTNIGYQKLPPELYGVHYLRFSNSHENKNISGSFTSKENANVYVLFDSKSKPSPWLIGYQKLNDTVRNNAGTEFHVFRKEVKKGEQVNFGSLGDGEMYSIVVVPTYSMDEQDGRPILKLKAEDAKVTGEGINKANFKKSDYVEFTQNTENSITFTVNPGVANIYLMRYHYMNMNDHPVKVRLKIEDANGILLRNDDIEFPIRQDKWKILNTTSGGFINAGVYKITLESNQMKGLRIESFEFQ
ncbi:malectin domain-containing carbohydrate-binding protein [Flavobacteriaceae bacterium SZ-1-7]|uniref:malectin domain-containing carbohydrate-binding protein n=1 Tax=Tamlana sedimenti TaxID=3134126 RepID=UPI00312AA235